jgi:integrase
MATQNGTTLPFHPQSQISPTNEEAMKTSDLAQLHFLQAARAWLETRKPYLHPRTFLDYQHHIKTMTKVFGDLRLPEIDAEQIRAFQKTRMLRAGASAINKECSVLQQMLKRIGKWSEIAPNFQPLRLPREGPGRAITEQEEDRWFRMAASNPEWSVCYHASLLSINTTAGPGEIRHIRLKDFSFTDHPPWMDVQDAGAKREARLRRIPLNDSAIWALQQLEIRAGSMGAFQPEHFLIPFRISTRRYDVTRPTKGWRTVHEGICAASGIEFRQYDFRHTAISRLLRNPQVSLETARKISGHVSVRMMRHYFHGDLGDMKQAVDALRKPGVPPAPPVAAAKSHHKKPNKGCLKLMIQCPTANKLVFTGTAADEQSFRNEANVYAGTFACPECGQNHAWEKKDALLLAA